MITNLKFYKRMALFGIAMTIGVLSYCVYLSIKNVNLQEQFVKYSIGVVDGIVMKQQAKCFSVHGDAEKMLNDVFSKARTAEMKIKTEYEQIRLNKKLSPKQKQQEIFKVEKKWKLNSADYNKQINDIRLLDQKLTAHIKKTLNVVLSELARKLDLFLIINKGNELSLNVFYNTPHVDVTEKVIKALDEKLASFSIKSVS